MRIVFRVVVWKGVKFIVRSQLWPKAERQITIRIFIALVSGSYLCIRAFKIDLSPCLSRSLLDRNAEEVEWGEGT